MASAARRAASGVAPRVGHRRRGLRRLGRLGWRGAASRPNLLLVTIDTLRADHVGAYGAPRPARRASTRWPPAACASTHAQSAGAHHRPSHATILTGLYPPVHGVRDNVVFPLDARTARWPRCLKAAGYRTAAFVGAYPVAAAFGFRQGFDAFSEDFKESPIPGAGAQRPANDVVDATLGWLRRPRTAPFFVWMHLYDPHAPTIRPSPIAPVRGRPYDGEIAFADAQLGRVFDWLRSSGTRRTRWWPCCPITASRSASTAR
jgi:arylsulfatase A-like enzyme